jgi:hypothetical protein
MVPDDWLAAGMLCDGFCAACGCDPGAGAAMTRAISEFKKALTAMLSLAESQFVFLDFPAC